VGNILKQILTGKDNQTHDVIRWLTVLAFLVGIILEIYHAVIGGDFNLEQYGIGMGSMLAASSIGIRIKASTEPE